MKTASRIFLTFILLAFFSGMTFSQAAATDNSAQTDTKSVTAPTDKSDISKNSCCAKPAMQGKNFVDKNGDGKCDNCGTTGKCKGTGTCNGKGQGFGSGCGKGQGAAKCGGQGHQHGNCCGSKGSNAPATKPNK